MGYRAKQYACCCGEPADRILEIGFSSDGMLVVHFWCSACQRVLHMSMPLDECRRECPPPDTVADSFLADGDAHFLEALGIALPE